MRNASGAHIKNQMHVQRNFINEHFCFNYETHYIWFGSTDSFVVVVVCQWIAEVTPSHPPVSDFFCVSYQTGPLSPAPVFHVEKNMFWSNISENRPFFQNRVSLAESWFYDLIWLKNLTPKFKTEIYFSFSAFPCHVCDNLCDRFNYWGCTSQSFGKSQFCVSRRYHNITLSWWALKKQKLDCMWFFLKWATPVP